jgi:hypothetical protein
LPFCNTRATEQAWVQRAFDLRRAGAGEGFSVAEVETRSSAGTWSTAANCRSAAALPGFRPVSISAR